MSDIAELAGNSSETPETEVDVPMEAGLGSKERLVTTAALGALAVVASITEYAGMMKGWPEPFGYIRESGRHPLVGYLAASIASRKSRFNNWYGLLAAGTLGDIGTEAAQGFILSGPAHTLDFIKPREIPGNIQDYWAAMGGTAWFMLRQGLATRHAGKSGGGQEHNPKI